jgi:hypothetical protein
MHGAMRIKKISHSIILALLGFLVMFGGELSAQVRLIVKLKPESSALSSGWTAALQLMQAKYGLISEPLFHASDNKVSMRIDGFDRSRYQSMVLADSGQVDALINEVQNSGAVEWIEIDHPLTLFEVPNDELFRYQWHHQNIGQEYYGIERIPGGHNDTLRIKSGTPGADIGTVPARDKTDVKVRPLVVIIDTGLDTRHPDIVANLWANPDEIADNGIDDDHNGYIDDLHGWDFSGDTIQFFNLIGDNDPTDQHGHGTHVAGIACGVSGNSIGIAGVASGADVLGLKIFPNAFTSVGMQAIMYASDIGADVINMSWGNYYPSRALDEILQYACKRDIILVAAIGNFGDSAKTYPAAFPTTITVGASNSDDEVTDFSSYGSWMDLVAPGLDILSLRADTLDMYVSNAEPEVRIIEDYYYLADGSSMSAPMVAGAAAEILSYSPGLGFDSVRNILRLSARDLIDPYNDGSEYPGHDNFSGWGRLDLKAALDLVGGRLARIDLPKPRSLFDGPVTITGSAWSDFGDDYFLSLKRIASDNGIDSQLVVSAANVLNGDLATLSFVDGPGRYMLTLAVGENVYRREVYFTSEPEIEILSPLENDTVKGVLTFRGTVVAPGFENYLIEMYPASRPLKKDTIIHSTGYTADSVVGSYSLAGAEEGEYTFNLILRSQAGVSESALNLFVSNGFSLGFPRPAKSLLNYGPAVYDLDGNGRHDLVACSRGGIAAYNHIGGFIPGRWRWISEVDYEGPPAVYDINHDGYGEVAYVSEGKLHLLRFDGYEMPGFPKNVPVETGQNGYPTVYFADMDSDGLEEIIYVTMDGDIYAFRHDGGSYFASLHGYFAEAAGAMIEYIPVVFCDDFNLDGQNEMIVMMRDAISIFNTHNGIEPDWVPQSQIGNMTGMTGACMADFDGDSLLELGFIGREVKTEVIYIGIMELDGTYLEGFPKYLERVNYLINYPAAADLDLDGKAEILLTISSIDFAEVWIIRSDGSTWSRAGGPEDSYFATFSGSAGPPAVADVNGDGTFDIIVRQGNFFPGRNNEKIYAFDQNGMILDGWPLYTFTNPNNVIYRLHTPTIMNLGLGDDTLFADLLISADDSSLYAWELPIAYDSNSIAWAQFGHDSRNSGILPPTLGQRLAPPPPDNLPPPSPAGFYLAQNYPNPFNAQTQIRFRLMRGSYVEIEIFNLLGQKINTLVSRELQAGEHRVTWEGKNSSGDEVSSGVYFYRLKTAYGTLSRKMILVK